MCAYWISCSLISFVPFLILNCSSQDLLVTLSMKYQQFYFTFDLMLDVSLFWKILESVSLFRLPSHLHVQLVPWGLKDREPCEYALVSQINAVDLILQACNKFNLTNQEKQLISTFSSLNQNLLVLCFNACVYLYMPFLSSYILKKKKHRQGQREGARPPYARFTPLTWYRSVESSAAVHDSWYYLS